MSMRAVSPKGFTLVELMISIVLGLLVVAAATSVLFTAQSSASLQAATAELRDDASFGMRFVESRIRMAGLRGMHDASHVSEQKTNQNNPLSGIVFSSNNLPGLNVAYLTKQASAAVTNTDIKSDQITIRFRLQQAMADCEGQNRQAGDWVVERYFVAAANTGVATDLALYCDAAWYTPTIALTGMGVNAAVIVPRVDYFGVQYGVDADKNNMLDPPVYYGLDAYKAQDNLDITTTNLPLDVVAVRLGVIIRSSVDTKNTLLESPITYNVLGQEVILITGVQVVSNDSKNRFARKVYEVTQQLPNAVGGAYATDISE